MGPFLHGPFLHSIWFGLVVAGSIVLAVFACRVVLRRGIPGVGFMRARDSSFAGMAGDFRTADRDRRGWRPFAAQSDGNTAFNEWRGAELARLEDERRKLEAAHQEFAAFVDNLRRAKDREEFDRFMHARHRAQVPTQSRVEPL